MRDTETAEITQLLNQWSAGDDAALQRLLPEVMPELSKLAASYMRREARGHILQTTALINEAWLRVTDRERVHWVSRSHFFAVAAQAMRHILVDYARGRKRLKRNCGDEILQLDEALLFSDSKCEDLIWLDDALKKLALCDVRKCHVIELRFFAGLTIDETAEVLRLSPNSVIRDWALAKAWLMREMESANRRGPKRLG